MNPIDSFPALAERCFDTLMTLCDDAGLDYEDTADALTITLNTKHIYLINAHTIMRQIWLSSPISGAWHFHWDTNAWLDTRFHQDLFTVLATELHQNYQIDFKTPRDIA